jgi:hypothetical protein
MQDVPYGYCHCGCGQRTPISAKTERRWGYVKGEPRKFIPGHAKRGTYEMDPATGCWDWRGVRDYGRVIVDGRSMLAHRWVYEIHRGTIPAALSLDHLCRNRGCVNPDHLDPVTHAENCRRGNQAKLTAEDAALIRASVAAGVPRRTLAMRYGVSKSAIQRVVVGDTWTAT